MTYSKRPHDHAGRQPAADDHRQPDEPHGRPGFGALADIMLQLDRGSPSADSESVHAAAEHGTRGAATSLPHLDTIQQAFGRHDVSGIEAHVGGAATEGALAMGARAYATGNHVAFADTPSLHTAAHEAAHVVQQRGGVQLEGGVGASGDAYEQHADRVADAVVAGQSAQGLLDEMKPGAGAQAGVQRTVQMDRFIGIEGKHHLHIDIGQEHYKYGTDRGSRIDFGGNGNYRLDSLKEARNYLVDNSFTANGGQACIDWLEEQCRAHDDWDEEQGFKTSYEKVEEKNPHVESLLSNAANVGLEGDDFAETLEEAKKEVIKRESKFLEDGTDEEAGSHYAEGTSKEELTETVNSTTLKEILMTWSGYDTETYDPEGVKEQFKRYAVEFLRDKLREEYPLALEKIDHAAMARALA